MGEWGCCVQFVPLRACAHPHPHFSPFLFFFLASFSSFFQQLFSFFFYISLLNYFPESGTPGSSDQLSGKSCVRIQVWAFLTSNNPFFFHTPPSFSFLLLFSPLAHLFFPSLFFLAPLPCLSPWVSSFSPLW